MVQNRIRMLRKEAGYNQKELGEILQVGQTTISAWEKGRNEPPTEYSHKMAKLFGCSIGYLMGYESESEYRGLSEKEWYEYKRQKHLIEMDKKDKEEIESALTREEEIESLSTGEQEDYQKELNIQEWENARRYIFPEAIEIDAILERTDADGRKRACVVIILMCPHD